MAVAVAVAASAALAVAVGAAAGAVAVATTAGVAVAAAAVGWDVAVACDVAVGWDVAVACDVPTGADSPPVQPSAHRAATATSRGVAALLRRAGDRCLPLACRRAPLRSAQEQGNKQVW